MDSNLQGATPVAIPPYPRWMRVMRRRESRSPPPSPPAAEPSKKLKEPSQKLGEPLHSALSEHTLTEHQHHLELHTHFDAAVADMSGHMHGTPGLHRADTSSPGSTPGHSRQSSHRSEVSHHNRKVLSAEERHSAAEIHRSSEPSADARVAPNTLPGASPTNKMQMLPISEKPKQPPTCPRKIIMFTVNLLFGLLVSQLIPTWLEADAYAVWAQVVKVCTQWCLAYIMVHVGYEFDLDKSRICSYSKDYLVAMTAAGFPWVFVALWFILVLPNPLPWQQALVAARFAAPTSAGILFSMLEAAGMKQTWLFQKARVLAIFDDLDTILLMVPLKVIISGIRWELGIDLGIVIFCLVVLWVFLHKLNLPNSWRATIFYASAVTIFCELLHFFTHDERIDPADVVDTVHLEVLLPAFTIGCVVRAAHVSQMAVPSEINGQPVLRRTNAALRFLRAHPAIMRERADRDMEATVNGAVSSVFMVFVGLSMPALFGDQPDAGGHRMLTASSMGSQGINGSGSSVVDDQLSPGLLVAHVTAVTMLMIVGKLFPIFVYRDEASIKTRLALALGMCPRGEVGAGVIVISLGFGIEGPAITIAVLALAINLVCSSGFIMAVKKLSANEGPIRDRSVHTYDDHRTLCPLSGYFALESLSLSSIQLVGILHPACTADHMALPVASISAQTFRTHKNHLNARGNILIRADAGWRRPQRI